MEDFRFAVDLTLLCPSCFASELSCWVAGFPGNLEDERKFREIKLPFSLCVMISSCREARFLFSTSGRKEAYGLFHEQEMQCVHSAVSYLEMRAWANALALESKGLMEQVKLELYVDTPSSCAEVPHS